MSPSNFSESGCAVCGRLTMCINLLNLSKLKLDLTILTKPGVTQKEHSASSDAIQDIEGPILEEGLDKVCKIKGKIPKMALANGKWIGKVPKELADLSF